MRCPQPQQGDVIIFRRLLAQTRHLAGSIALATLFGLLTIASSVALMSTGAWLIAAAALQPSIAELQIAIVGVRLFGITRGLFRYAERLTSHNATFQLLKQLRVWFYERLEPLAPARLASHRSGDLLSRVVVDIDTLQNFYVRVLSPPLVAVLAAVLMMVFIGSYKANLAPTLLTFYLAGGIAIPWLSWKLSSRANREIVSARANLNATLVDTLQGVSELLAYGSACNRTEEARRLSKHLVDSQQQLTRIEALTNSLILLLTGGATVTVLTLAIPRVEDIHLAAIVLGTVASFEMLGPLPLAACTLGGILEAARRLFEITAAGPAVSDPVPGNGRPCCFDVVVEGVSFQYGPEHLPALDNVSFTLSEGEHLAIVGPSGSGKTTLVNLLLRFWDYENGRIAIGGRDIRTYCQDDLRQWIGVVSQRTHLFNSTVRENLLVACSTATDDEIIAATQKAHIHDFIESLPQGYETQIGEQGTKLSGGERQRLAVARALLKDAPLLILDEPTANLDPMTGQAVMQDVRKAMHGRTVLLITHRLTDLDTFDQIVVLLDGRVVQQGRHRSLKQNDGPYSQMLVEENRRVAFPKSGSPQR